MSDPFDLDDEPVMPPAQMGGAMPWLNGLNPEQLDAVIDEVAVRLEAAVASLDGNDVRVHR